MKKFLTVILPLILCSVSARAAGDKIWVAFNTTPDQILDVCNRYTSDKVAAENMFYELVQRYDGGLEATDFIEICIAGGITDKSVCTSFVLSIYDMSPYPSKIINSYDRDKVTLDDAIRLVEKNYNYLDCKTLSNNTKLVKGMEASSILLCKRNDVRHDEYYGFPFKNIINLSSHKNTDYKNIAWPVEEVVDVLKRRHSCFDVQFITSKIARCKKANPTIEKECSHYGKNDSLYYTCLQNRDGFTYVDFYFKEIISYYELYEDRVLYKDRVDKSKDQVREKHLFIFENDVATLSEADDLIEKETGIKCDHIAQTGNSISCRYDNDNVVYVFQFKKLFKNKTEQLEYDEKELDERLDALEKSLGI